jgi:Uma2 family endonuclease
MSLTETKLITADELLAMGDIGRCELIYGELIMMSPAGCDHGAVAARFARYLGEFVEDASLGVVLGAETGFLVERDPDLVRAPDASFIRRARLGARLTRKFFSGVPDLAVEVISPGETRREVSEKVNMWLAHGTASVWVADPLKMTVTIHRTGKEPVLFSREQDLRDEAALPGFVLPLTKVFKEI